jgi:predicted GIY-YIG superfamily endonuclease
LTPIPAFVIFPAAKPMKIYSVYIMASKSRTLYTGVTSNLQQRVWQHREKQISGFSAKYNTTRLVYFESFKRSPRHNPAREANQGLVAQQQNCLDRIHEPRLERSKRNLVTHNACNLLCAPGLRHPQRSHPTVSF